MFHTAYARRGLVVAPHHLAAQAGLAVLREGGDAIEATVAAGAVDRTETLELISPRVGAVGRRDDDDVPLVALNVFKVLDE